MMMSSSGKQLKAGAASVENGVEVQVSTFSELVDDVTLLPKQIFAWIVSAKFGDLYAAAPTRHSNTVGVAFTLGDLVTVVLVFVCFEHRGCWMIFAELLNVQAMQRQQPDKQQAGIPTLAGIIVIYKNGESNCIDCVICLEEFMD
ncbi:Uncharacterized protein TCM_001871 [Theobroma cacao]|uniref:Uncharacterized protein n=1 Tax=Theobroma cacao TaxID=3641 RepID=A0A061DKP4_THECC|nr:Uncharacterized protein TCM_001871 [Theobroma cacao]